MKRPVTRSATWPLPTRPSIFNFQFSIFNFQHRDRQRRGPSVENDCKNCKLKIGSARRGLSLFEVVISLTIFACSMAAIGHLISTGVRGALRSRLESQAIMRCESKLGELAAGITPLQNTGGAAFPDDQSWQWSVAVTAGQHPGLYLVEVTTAHPSTNSAANISFTLRRLLRDPQLEMLAYQKLLDNTPVNQSSSSTTSSSSSSGASK